jgi:hypothetical protein
MNLKFYIIYTPESFSKLKLAIKSLLHFTNYQYVLVSNGLSTEEANQIEQNTKKSAYLKFIDLPGNITIPHGTALTHLFNISDDEYFCFMDSDIFAFADFTKDLEEKIKSNDVVSSGKPIEWWDKTSAFGYRGHCSVSPSGKNVAMTYFSVYKRSSISPLLSKYAISFERYMRKQQVPEGVQNLLSEKDQHTWKFNTAKLLNIVQAYSGYHLHYQEFNGLVHLGGVSRYSEHSIHGTRKMIKPDNYQALDRIKSRFYFHQLLSNITYENYSLPKLELYDLDFLNNIIKISNDLIQLNKNLKNYDTK